MNDKKITSGPRPTGGLVRRGKWRRRLAVGLVVLIALVAIGELSSRFILGLGDPPLWQNDPQIEYMFQPNQTGKQLGNKYHYNAYSMRSDDFPKTKSDPNEFRVMFFSNSILNGGNQTDQDLLATELLKKSLAQKLNRPVVVGNISCGGWGPPNYTAYAKRFGMFDADIVVNLVSSHDYGNSRTFQPVAGTAPIYPIHKPVSALWEGVTRYLLPRLLPQKANKIEQLHTSSNPAAIAECCGAMKDIILMAKAAKCKVVVAQHWRRVECGSGPLEGYYMLHKVAEDSGATVVNLGPSFKDAMSRGRDPYRDDIHPNVIGQSVIAEQLLPILVDLAENKPSSLPATIPAGVNP